MSDEDRESSTEPESALQAMLKRKLRTGLQPTQTKVTLPTGEITFYHNQGQEKLRPASCEERKSFGFVVDLKPDLTTGCVFHWLIISSQDVPQEVSIVGTLGVTHILSLLPGFELSPAVKGMIKEHCILDIFDEEAFATTDNSHTVSALIHAVEFIAKVKDSGGNVLVHCNAGISRAPTVVILYLITKENNSFDEAWSKVRTVRPGAKPNSGFLKYLKSLSPKLPPT